MMLSSVGSLFGEALDPLLAHLEDIGYISPKSFSDHSEARPVRDES